MAAAEAFLGCPSQWPHASSITPRSRDRGTSAVHITRPGRVRARQDNPSVSPLHRGLCCQAGLRWSVPYFFVSRDLTTRRGWEGRIAAVQLLLLLLPSSSPSFSPPCPPLFLAIFAHRSTMVPYQAMDERKKRGERRPLRVRPSPPSYLGRRGDGTQVPIKSQLPGFPRGVSPLVRDKTLA